MNTFLSSTASISAIEKFIEELPDKALHLGIRVLLAIVFFFIGTQLIKLVLKIMKKSMERAKVETGAIQFMSSFVKAALYILLILVLASSFGVDDASIIAILGSAGLAFGLALQGSLSNLAGGVLIMVLKPFKVGDYIVDGTGKEGVVTEIQIFFTKLLTVDNKTIILPNGALANNCITNVTAQATRRLDLPVSISYGSDIKLAKDILMDVIKKDEAVLKDKEMLIYVNELGESAVNVFVRFWVKTDDYWTARFRVIENCKLALDEAGVQIPFPQLDVHFDQPKE